CTSLVATHLVPPSWWVEVPPATPWEQWKGDPAPVADRVVIPPLERTHVDGYAAPPYPVERVRTPGEFAYLERVAALGLGDDARSWKGHTPEQRADWEKYARERINVPAIPRRSPGQVAYEVRGFTNWDDLPAEVRAGWENGRDDSGSIRRSSVKGIHSSIAAAPVARSSAGYYPPREIAVAEPVKVSALVEEAFAILDRFGPTTGLPEAARLEGDRMILRNAIGALADIAAQIVETQKELDDAHEAIGALRATGVALVAKYDLEDDATRERHAWQEALKASRARGGK
ncbi:MAG: hypothetical protein JWM74_5695, partial [Myxococcaceae bacterium]|nr:hypothetical protein [Myxococcaceae bacterium]